ncbi:MAG TPA: phosphoribosylglycinamide formyltransferase [Rickettsiales bacterium]|nr:phosphoribosylglycinamide formyltransferase [Rickettsiales bacterium]
MTKKPVAVLISGSGSNLQALIDACAQPDFPARIAMVISNKSDAYGLKRAKDAGIPTQVIFHQDYPDRDTFDSALHDAIIKAGAEYVCLAGFMRLLTAGFVEKWQGRMINIHPAILPSFKGIHTHERVLEAGVKIHGATVHYVVPEMDSGPIIIQAAVPVLPNDTAQTLGERVLKLEHKIYPEALRKVITGETGTVSDHTSFLIA